MSRPLSAWATRSDVQDSDKFLNERGTGAGAGAKTTWLTIRTALASLFAAVTHTHAQSDITGLAGALPGVAQVAEAVGMKERVTGATVRIYPTSSAGLWFRIQTPPGESALVDAPTAGENSADAI